MITRVAILDKTTGEIFTGYEKHRHHDIIQRNTVETKDLPWGYFKGANFEQGFIDENGKFYNREDGARHALECGQVETGKANIRCVFEGKRLFSENLW